MRKHLVSVNRLEGSPEHRQLLIAILEILDLLATIWVLNRTVATQETIEYAVEVISREGL